MTLWQEWRAWLRSRLTRFHSLVKYRLTLAGVACSVEDTLGPRKRLSRENLISGPLEKRRNHFYSSSPERLGVSAALLNYDIAMEDWSALAHSQYYVLWCSSSRG